MDAIHGVTIGALIIFVAAVILLLTLFIKHKCKGKDLISQLHSETRPENQLISEGDNSPDNTAVELGDVDVSNPGLDHMLNDEQFAEESSGLHLLCLTILRQCHQLTQSLYDEAKLKAGYMHNQAFLGEMESAAGRYNTRVAEVMGELVQPSGTRQLEDSVMRLVQQVRHVAMVIKNGLHMPGTLDWIDTCLMEVEDSLKVLRKMCSSLEKYGNNSEKQAQTTHHCEGLDSGTNPPDVCDNTDTSMA